MTIAICIGVVVFVILSNLGTVIGYIGSFLHFFRPVILGIVFAYVLNPLVGLFENKILKKHFKKTTRHILSLTISAVMVLFLLFLLGFFLVPQIASSVGMFVSNLDDYVASAEKVLKNISEYFAARNIDISGIEQSIEGMFASLQSALPTSLEKIFSVIGSIGVNILDFVIAAVLALYFLADKNRLLHGIDKIIRAVQKPETNRKMMDFLKRGHSILIRYIVFSLLDALFVGAANFIFMLAAGMPYGVLVSVVVGVTNLAPTFGPVVGGVIGAFLLFLVHPIYALQFLIFTVILQFFDGYVLKPRMFSGALGVPGVMVIACIVVGGKMFGVWGILLAIPFAAFIYYILREIVGRRLEKREEEKGSAKKATASVKKETASAQKEAEADQA